MLTLIRTIKELLQNFIDEVHYRWNDADVVVYPYITYTYTLEQLQNDNQSGIYIDFDVFDDRGNNNERIETIVEDIQNFYNNKNNRSLLTDDFLIRIDEMSISPFPTQSDRLQRRTGQLYLKIDWRK